VVIAQLLLIAALFGIFSLNGSGLSPAGWAAGISCGVITNVGLARGLSHFGIARLTPADWVTLVRATLAVGVAALIASSFDRPVSVTLLVSVAAVVLALDAVDGWVARRTETRTLGGNFDAEVDAFLILVLSVYVARSTGAWVLLIGAARYAFLVAGWALPWMRAPLPPRYWRKVVAATQGVVLTIAAADVLPLALTQAVLLAALVLLTESFGRDVWWLWSHRPATHSQAPATADPAFDHPVGSTARRRRGRLRTSVVAVLTILAIVIVWGALVFPSRPGGLTPTAFVRLPLEGLVLVALAVVLPATARRVLAGVVGVALVLMVVLKILNIGFLALFARPFDLMGDLGEAGDGIETLRATLGQTEANLLIVGAVVLVVALVVVCTLAMLRLTRVAARNRRWSLGAITALGAVWLLCWLFGAQLVSHSPIASTSTAGFLVGEVRAVQADIHDEGVFAKQIRHDAFRNIPGSRLLTGLRGKDVLLDFVESYGRISVHGASFSPAVDALLVKGTKRLHASGFSARSAFLTASSFGGMSWLGHSTLQSGVWADSQRRYEQLVGTDRFTLSDAFRRAGWRTINFAPADDRAFPEGSSFYHYDKLYDRRQMGYRGPGYSYSPMPDQYMYSALQRLELGKVHRRSLFAEVDTTSSHLWWTRIPNMVPWRDVGNGSIFDRRPGWVSKGAFWSVPGRVRAAYARSLRYSLNSLISFVQHYGKKNLVLIVVGDEQPPPPVTVAGASHDVVVSLIAQDPAVLKRITGWGWQAGLLPSSGAPVWRMSAFRNRFLTAFGRRPAITGTP
jgi:hypothetical protein